MQNRRIEVRSFVYLGETLEYTVTVIEPCPPPCQDNPYCEGGRCVAGPRDVKPTPAPAKVVEKRRPAKAEYVRAFYAAGVVPRCVVETICAVGDRVAGAREAAVSRRVRKAVARFNVDDPASYYDAGAIGRISHYFYDSLGRDIARQYDRGLLVAAD